MDSFFQVFFRQLDLPLNQNPAKKTMIKPKKINQKKKNYPFLPSFDPWPGQNQL
jgi:hypothetical protein